MHAVATAPKRRRLAQKQPAVLSPPKRRRISRKQPDVYHPDWARTLIIFDWDDTLCPTTWALAHEDHWDAGCPHELQKLVVRVLTEAQTLGKVVIVTSAERDWVDESCAQLLPLAKPVVAGIPTYSAREYRNVADRWSTADREYQKVLKLRAMRAAAADQDLLCVMSIGDSSREHEAAREFVSERLRQNPDCTCHCKTIKLHLPDLRILRHQLSVLSISLRRAVLEDGGFDVVLGVSIQ